MLVAVVVVPTTDDAVDDDDVVDISAADADAAALLALAGRFRWANLDVLPGARFGACVDCDVRPPLAVTAPPLPPPPGNETVEPLW